MKRSLICCFLILLIGYNVFCQDTTKIHTKIDKLINDATSAPIEDSVKALETLNQALELAEKQKLLNKTIQIHNNIARLYQKYGNLNRALEAYNMSMKLAGENKLPKEEANISIEIAKIHSYQGNLNNALYYLSKAETFFKNQNDSAGLYKTFQNYSLIYQSNKNYYLALQYGLEALRLSENYKKENNNEQLIISLSNIAQIYALLNQHNKALQNYQKAISIAEKIKNNTYLPMLYLNIGNIHRQLEQNANALNYFVKAHKIYSDEKNTNGIITCLIDIAKIYELEANYPKAINYYMRASKYAENEKMFSKIIEINYEIAQIYLKLKQFERAILYLDENLEIAKKSNNPEVLSCALWHVGNYYLSKEDINSSLRFLKQSLDLVEASTNFELQSKICSSFAEAYSAQNNYKDAFKYLSLSKHLLLKSLATKEQNTFQMLEFIFEVANKDKDIELLKKSNQLEKLQHEKTKSQKNSILIGAFLILLLLLISIYSNFVIRKKNKILTTKRREIETINRTLLEKSLTLEKQKNELNDINEKLSQTIKQLEESQQELDMSNKTKDKLLSIIAHDLRTPFASIFSYVRLIKRDINNLSKEEIINLTDELFKVTNNVSMLLENLLQWSLTQTGKIKFNPINVNIKNVINQSVELFKVAAETKGIKIENRVTEDITTEGDFDMLYSIFRNLISNAIKFANQNTSIIIDYEKLPDNKARFMVKNYGAGMTQKQIDEILKDNIIISTKGTAEEKGAGLGLILCKEFLQKHNSSLEINSIEGQEVTFSFVLNTL